MAAIQQMLLMGSMAAATYATWNPLDEGSNIALYGGNLEVSVSSGWSGVRGTISKSTGKWYFEVYCNYASTGGDVMIGISTSFANLNTWGSTTSSWTYYSMGDIYGYGSYGATYVTGDTIGVAIDFDADTITFYKNNTSQGTVSITASQVWFPSVFVYPPADITANFGATAFTYSPPSGYNAGFYE